jgi:regulator of sigma E protease
VQLEEVQAPVAVAIPQAFSQATGLTGEVVGQIVALPGQLISQRATPAGGAPVVGGPIEIFRVTGQVAQFGIPTFLKLVGVLSVNLGVINIIPFPGLDGGRLFFVLLGALLRRRLSPQVEAAIHAVGFVLLLGLLVIVSISDIRRAVGG